MLEIGGQGKREADLDNRYREGDKRGGWIPADSQYSSRYKEMYSNSRRRQKITVISCKGDRLLIF